MPTPRPASAGDVPHLREIEVSAGEVFREIGMESVARDAPPPTEAYLDAAARRQLWVLDDEATSTSEVPVAYLWAFAMDSALHIEQVSVAATHARRGLGRLLIEHIVGIAREGGALALTLTTFARVPWNAPYYERIGFRILPESEWTPSLRAVRRAEAAHGLDAWPRVCMRRDL